MCKYIGVELQNGCTQFDLCIEFESESREYMLLFEFQYGELGLVANKCMFAQNTSAVHADIGSGREQL